MTHINHHLYILENQRGSYYIGVTNDINRRVQEHNNGRSLATRGRGPWTLVYSELHDSAPEAKRREYNIKKKKRKSYIKNLINDHGRVV